MNSLPIESACWREYLKQRIGLETAVIRALIQWGMAESASEVCRSLEQHFGGGLETQLDARLQRPVRFSGPDRAFVRDLLREVYLRTREIPRRKATQERLHDGLLTSFEELALLIVRCYEEFPFNAGVLGQTEQAA